MSDFGFFTAIFAFIMANGLIIWMHSMGGGSGVFGVRGSRQVWAVRVGTAALAGAASGVVLSWLIADVWNLFGAPVSAWIAGLGGVWALLAAWPWRK